MCFCLILSLLCFGFALFLVFECVCEFLFSFLICQRFLHSFLHTSRIHCECLHAILCFVLAFMFVVFVSDFVFFVVKSYYFFWLSS